MREIKFRVWDSISNKYRLLSMNANNQNLGLGFEVSGGIGSNVTTMYHSVGDVVEQYTGMTDKNGVEIFEGDILQHKASKFINFTVVFKYGCYYAHDTSEIMLDELLGSLNFDNEMTIIGNIHENPELLEVEK